MTHGEKLIAALVEDPPAFIAAGSAYPLLQAYFKGLSASTLKPLLESESQEIQRTAVWIASELGGAARGLVSSILPLARSSDRYVAYHALEALAVCSNIDAIRPLIATMEGQDSVLRVLAMRLIGHSSDEVLEEMRTYLSHQNDLDVCHFRAISALLSEMADAERLVMKWLSSEQPLLRKYAAILARRKVDTKPELILRASSSNDMDVRRYAEETIDALQVQRD